MRCLGVVAALVVTASACASESGYPPVPRDRTAWGVLDADARDIWLVVDAEGRAPLDSFAERARSFGCITEKGGVGRRWNAYSAILARCDTGTIVLARASYAGSRFACLKPTTRARCEELLGQIVVADRPPMISN